MKPKILENHLDFELVPETSGKIVDSVWIKNDRTELIIKFSWGDDLHFKPLQDNEKSL